jgi:uncharacterized protein YgfB (UPF0149 family)
VEDLKREVDNTRTIIALQGLEELKESFSEAGLSDDQWKSFEMVFKGDVDSILTARTEAISHQIKAIIAGSGESSDMAEPPEKWPQEILSAERDKAKAQVGLDGKNSFATIICSYSYQPRENCSRNLTRSWPTLRGRTRAE